MHRARPPSASGKMLDLLVGYANAESCVTFSPDGGTVASGSAGNTIKLWKRPGMTIIAVAIGTIAAASFANESGGIPTGESYRPSRMSSVGSGRKASPLSRSSRRT